MTHACCLGCRLRFSPAAAAYLPACPQCGERLQTMAALDGTVGFRLFRLADGPPSLPEAIAVSLPNPDPNRPRT